MYSESTNIFPSQYGAKSGDACSIFLLSEPIDCAVAAVQYCEHALDILQPAEFTIGRMRATIENSLSEIYRRQPGATMLVALYSSSDRQYSAFRTNGAALKELAGYDCQGSAAYLGHYLIRDRYRAMQSMDALDLRSYSRSRPRHWTASGNFAKDVLNLPRSWCCTLTDASRLFSVSGRAGVNCQNWRCQRI